MKSASIHILVLLIYLSRCTSEEISNYKIGAGISDVTGPASNVPMMGYAKPGQIANGIHLRQFSRAFIISNKDGSKPVVYVSVDISMMSDAIKMEVIKQLRATYGDRYTDQNIILSATHTHSTPGGHMTYVLYAIVNYGFYKPTFNAAVDGIIESVNRAHNNLQDGHIFINSNDLLDTNINRSPTAYNQNPESERKQYKYNVDKTMIILKLIKENGEHLGMISWFPVHPTSMNNTNTLISGDNLGYAAILFEKEMNDGAPPGYGSFVSAFGSTNLGDVSPNIKGPKCIDTGKTCHIETNACGNTVQNCIASGPGDNMFDSTKIIANNLYGRALSLYKSASIKLTGPVDFKQKYADMTNVEIKLNKTTTVKTCKPAMGFSFAAGTTDGPGLFDFKQSDTQGNGFWQIVSHLIKKPSADLIECHKPKPILFATGEMKFPYAWQPTIVDLNLFRIGQLFIVSVPGEFTTMAGRRLKNEVKKSLISKGFPNDIKIVIAGLSNTYISYITTFEEYQVQRYEGASTIYGPYTLNALIMHIKQLAEAIADNNNISRGTPPDDIRSKVWTLMPKVEFDRSPPRHNFGDLKKQPLPEYKRGQQVLVKFQTSNMRNSNQRNHTFLSIEKKTGDVWTTDVTDADWETQLQWEGDSVLGFSTSTCIWNIPINAHAGTYRMKYQGHKKDIWSKQISSYEGTTNDFIVT